VRTGRTVGAAIRAIRFVGRLAARAAGPVRLARGPIAFARAEVARELLPRRVARLVRLARGARRVRARFALLAFERRGELARFFGAGRARLGVALAVLTWRAGRRRGGVAVGRLFAGLGFETG